MKLQRNNGKMSVRSRGAKWEWHTADAEGICNIHVHNQDLLWAYEFELTRSYYSDGYDTKDLAYQAAIKRLATLLEAAMRELEGELE